MEGNEYKRKTPAQTELVTGGGGAGGAGHHKHDGSHVKRKD